MAEDPIEILLVEDNPSDVELTLHALRKNNLANRIKIARDGAEALDYIFGMGADPTRSLDHVPRVILLDFKLPKIDGIEVLAKIKSDPRAKRIPVVVLTSSREDRDLFLSYEMGVNNYMVKPVDFAQFTEAVRQLGLYWLLLNQQPSGPSEP